MCGKNYKSVLGNIDDPLHMPLMWDRPLFHANDRVMGIDSVRLFGEMDSLSVLNGMVVALGFVDDNRINSRGSGVMVAPGLLVTATHVAKDISNTAGTAFSFPAEGHMLLWQLHALQMLSRIKDKPLFLNGEQCLNCDASLSSCSLISKLTEPFTLRMAHLEIAIPEIGERLWAVGYRENPQGDVQGMTMICSSGCVTAQYVGGRDVNLPGPCLEVNMKTIGSMSGGPVFNAQGYVVGVVSSSFENGFPSYVSLIWPAFVGEVSAPWPPDFWPTGMASLKVAKDLGCARIHGDVEVDRNDDEISVTLHLAKENP